MKRLLFLGIVFFTFTISAQDAEKQAVQKVIETFFKGFHTQDSTIIKSTVANDAILQTIAKDSTGQNYIQREDFSKFVKSIVGIPKTMKFKESIDAYSIQVDGPMANAWTNYRFHINDKLSHCGVNSFQLVKFKDEWKIIYLIDTRRKEGCE